MKTLTATDRKNLIKLASSLPKGDKGRRAILAGLDKTAAKSIILEGLDPATHKEIAKAFEKVYKAVKDSHFGYAYAKAKVSPDKFEEFEQDEHGGPAGYGVIGSILPHLSSSARKEVEKALKSQRVTVADTKDALYWLEDGHENGMGWEDTLATWGDLWTYVGGKAVDAVAIGKSVELL